MKEQIRVDVTKIQEELNRLQKKGVIITMQKIGDFVRNAAYDKIDARYREIMGNDISHSTIEKLAFECSKRGINKQKFISQIKQAETMLISQNITPELPEGVVFNEKLGRMAK